MRLYNAIENVEDVLIEHEEKSTNITLECFEVYSVVVFIFTTVWKPLDSSTKISNIAFNAKIAKWS